MFKYVLPPPPAIVIGWFNADPLVEAADVSVPVVTAASDVGNAAVFAFTGAVVEAWPPSTTALSVTGNNGGALVAATTGATDGDAPGRGGGSGFCGNGAEAGLVAAC